MSATISDNVEIFAGTIPRKDLAKAMKCTERTIIRYERAGMPFIAVGNRRLYRLAAVRDWILSHERRPQQPQRGRPRKFAAA